ncbi:MAG: 3-hydroxyacyl-CoA dehydrogenase family protein, partial [Synergistaceae bacterium]|nr:3-hydroxyacyl-CoA dehydrogenase family protein [Synergistaceae bacterium]
KRPAVLRKEANGFIANRLQFALLREALHIVESGVASMEEVDEAVKSSIGRRLADTGPFETADLGGLDVFSSIASYLFADLSADTKPPRLLTEKVREGLLGAKTGQGLYNWEPERKKEVLEARTRTLVHFLRQDRAEIK